MTENARIAQKWLLRNTYAEKEIRALKNRLYKLETEINNCVKALDKNEIQAGHSSNAQEFKLAEYADLKNEIEASIKRIQQNDATMLAKIKLLEDSLERLLLIERYVNRKRWVKVFDELYISKSTAFRTHDNALENLYKFIPQGDLLEISGDD